MSHMWKKDKDGFVSNLNRIGLFWSVLWCWAFVHNLHSKSGTSGARSVFEKFRKSKYRSKFLIWFLGIIHQRVSLEKLWAIRKNWSCPEILEGYRKSLLNMKKQIDTRDSPRSSTYTNVSVHSLVRKMNSIGIQSHTLIHANHKI